MTRGALVGVANTGEVGVCETEEEPPLDDVTTTAGVPDALDEAVPVPITFFADTRNEYEDPFVSPVTTYDVAADVPSDKVDHVDPPSVDCSIT